MSPRFVTVDVTGADDAVAAAAIARAVALAEDDDRLLLFGHAAVVAARIDQEEREAREGAWLDEAAAWLLSSSTEPPPKRPAPKPLMKATAVVNARAEALALPRSDRVVEMSSSMLVMAVPTAKDIDSVDNAHLWLVGGAPFGVAHHGNRVVVSVGDRVVVVSLEGGDASIVDHAFDGTKNEQSIGLQVTNKMSIRGLSP